MTDDRTPEQRTADAAASALFSLGVLRDELSRLSTELALVGDWGAGHGDSDGRKLRRVAEALEATHDGTVTDVVRRIAATLPQR